MSGPERGQRGCLLELGWNGREPVDLGDGTKHAFPADGDSVTLRAAAPGAAGSVVSLGEVAGTACPAP